jgi:uncharacterized membrane protein YhiD involved in acid resistance
LKKFRIIQEILAKTPYPIAPTLSEFFLNMILAAILGYILGYLYTRYGTSLSNRRMFSKNFPMLSMTTMFIITVVRSSLTLSLGLVGALSIVRFRAAIKEPEELGFLFLAISIGLGLGASQPIITLVAFALISIIILFRHFSQKAEFTQNLLLTITSFNPQVATLEKISDILKRSFSRCQIKRFDETKEMIEVLFLVEFESFDQLEKVKTQLRQLDNSIKISFLDNRGVFLS